MLAELEKRGDRGENKNSRSPSFLRASGGTEEDSAARNADGRRRADGAVGRRGRRGEGDENERANENREKSGTVAYLQTHGYGPLKLLLGCFFAPLFLIRTILPCRNHLPVYLRALFRNLGRAWA